MLSRPPDPGHSTRTLDIPEALRETRLLDVIPPSKTSPAEQKLLRFLTRSWVTGVGQVADVGCGLGGSTLAMCLGLHENDGVHDKVGRVHAFDQFRRAPPGGTSPPAGSDESFVDEFRRNLGPYLDYCVIYEGDIRRSSAHIGPIELLFVDIAKSLTTFQSVVERFYGDLVPGRSLLLHQDFSRPRLPWLHYSTAFLLPYFEIVAPPVDSTLILRLVREIPDHALGRLLADDFDTDERVRLITHLDLVLGQVISDDEQRARYEAILELAKAFVFHWLGEFGEAERRARQLETHPLLRDRFGFMFEEIRSRGSRPPGHPDAALGFGGEVCNHERKSRCD